MRRRRDSTEYSEKYFTILPDSAAGYATWRQLVSLYEVMGAKVHDAYHRQDHHLQYQRFPALQRYSGC